METQNKTKTVGVYFEEQQISDLKETAKKLGMTMAAFCRVASLRLMREENLILNKSGAVA